MNSTGETQLWLMSSNSIVDRRTIVENGVPFLVGSPWSIVATDDMNKDGNPDIIWYNAVSGETQIWYMNTDQILDRATVYWEGNTGPAFVGLPWRITSTNDFDRDYLSDIVWYNEDTGETQLWYMFGATIKSRVTVDAASDGGDALVGAPWQIMPH